MFVEMKTHRRELLGWSLAPELTGGGISTGTRTETIGLHALQQHALLIPETGEGRVDVRKNELRLPAEDLVRGKALTFTPNINVDHPNTHSGDAGLSPIDPGRRDDMLALRRKIGRVNRAHRQHVYLPIAAEERSFYLAYSTARVSRSSVTLISPG